MVFGAQSRYTHFSSQSLTLTHNKLKFHMYTYTHHSHIHIAILQLKDVLSQLSVAVERCAILTAG